MTIFLNHTLHASSPTLFVRPKKADLTDARAYDQEKF